MSLQREKIVARDRNHLRQLVYESIQKNGPNCDLNFIDVSGVEDMDGVFAGVNRVFNGDISRWNVSSVVSMWGMFAYSQFNGDVSRWNVSDVWQMPELFAYSQFMGDVSGWEVTDDVCAGMFYGSLLELKGLLPEWYRAIEEKQRLENGCLEKERLEIEENSVKEEEFNQSDDGELENLSF